MRAYPPPKKKLTINFDTKGSLAPQTDKYKGDIVLAGERTITPAPFTEILGSTMVTSWPGTARVLETDSNTSPMFNVGSTWKL